MAEPVTNRPSRRAYLFVIEDGLGHAVHAMNIERVLQDHPEISSRVLRVRPGETPGVRPLPATKNWSIQTSWATRQLCRRQVATERPDALFIHTQVAALFARSIMRAVPTVVSLDATPLNMDTMADAYQHRRQAPVAERFKLELNRRVLGEARAIVTWSRWAADSVVRDYGVTPDRVHVIRPGVDANRFHPRQGERDPGPVRILFVGGDFERKGGADLLAAIRPLADAVEVDIVTSSPAALVGAGARVRIHSAVAANSTMMTELYRRADIFALPTRADTLALVLAEAMASGLPIVTTQVGGIPELVLDGHNGLVVLPGNARHLSEALRTLVERPDLRQLMGERGRRMAEAEHDVDRNCEQIFEIMRRITSPFQYRASLP
jgi:glycosyltransferase involved in cell wall biosynthesis